jgi:mRNA-degrading endonuclease HigB of HigAB toxin-antitoxin module
VRLSWGYADRALIAPPLGDRRAELIEGRSLRALVGDRIVFNVAGNKYRLVVGVDYRFRTVYVKWVGAHREYDDIDVEKV